MNDPQNLLRFLLMELKSIQSGVENVSVRMAELDKRLDLGKMELNHEIQDLQERQTQLDAVINKNKKDFDALNGEFVLLQNKIRNLTDSLQLILKLSSFLFSLPTKIIAFGSALVMAIFWLHEFLQKMGIVHMP